MLKITMLFTGDSLAGWNNPSPCLTASFFAFHLLLGYLVDHISIHTAFFICSVMSMALVLSYRRIVVGARFAFVETAMAQFVYLIGFSYAFFFEGFTGLAVTIRRNHHSVCSHADDGEDQLVRAVSDWQC